MASRRKREQRERPAGPAVAVADITARLEAIRAERDGVLRAMQLDFERQLAYRQGGYDAAIGELEKLLAPAGSPAPALPEATGVPPTPEQEAAAAALVESAAPEE